MKLFLELKTDLSLKIETQHKIPRKFKNNIRTEAHLGETSKHQISKENLKSFQRKKTTGPERKENLTTAYCYNLRSEKTIK